MTIDLRRTCDGLLLSVKVVTGARKSEIRGEHAGGLRVAVNAVPQKGKANEAIIALLSHELDVPKNQLQIVSGHTSRNKTIGINGVELNPIMIRLQQIVTVTDRD